MTAPNTNDPPTGTQEGNSESQSQESNSGTPPTPSPAPSVTDGDASKRYIGILEQTLREQNAQIQKLMDAPKPQAPVAPAAITAEEEKQRFYNDPAGMTRDIINQALKESIQPLQDFVKGLRIDGSPFSQMIAKFKSDARFADSLNDPQVMAAVEKIMEKSELTDINMQSAIVHAVGLRGMGLLGTVAPAPAPAPTPSPTPAPGVVLPPHVRPSAAPVPAGSSNNGKPQRPAMTENQRRIMREQRFKSEEEYWQWMELPASEVAHTDLGQPKGGK